MLKILSIVVLLLSSVVSARAQVSSDSEETTTTVNENVNMGVGVPGVNVNIGTTVTHETKTTVTTKTSSNHNSTTRSANEGCRGKYGMPASTFESAKQTISNQKFDDTRLSTAKQIINNNCLTAAQIKSVILLFSFEDTRLDLAKYAYKKCADSENYFLINDAFKFESSVTELNDFIN